LFTLQRPKDIDRRRPGELALVPAASRQPDTDPIMHQHLGAVGTLLANRQAWWVGPAPKTVISRTSAVSVSVSARMSRVAVASETASTRIIARAREEVCRIESADIASAPVFRRAGLEDVPQTTVARQRAQPALRWPPRMQDRQCASARIRTRAASTLVALAALASNDAPCSNAGPGPGYAAYTGSRLYAAVQHLSLELLVVLARPRAVFIGRVFIVGTVPASSGPFSRGSPPVAYRTAHCYTDIGWDFKFIASAITSSLIS